MANQEISIIIKANSAQAARSLEEVAAALKNVETATGGARASTDKMAASSRQVETATQSMTGQFERLKSAVLAATSAFAALQAAQAVREIVAAQVAYERLTVAMTAAMGATRRGTEAMAFVKSEAARLGLSLADASQAYAKLAAASRGTALEGDKARKIFTAVSEAATALQLSSGETSGALYAISQMMSKGTVQAEELRGQLGERLPGAFQLAAKAMGVSTMELGKMLEGGKLLSDDFLPRFADALREQYAGSVEQASRSTGANLNRMNTAIFEAKAALGEAFGTSTQNVILSTTSAIKAMQDELADPRTRQAIADLSAEMEKLIVNAGEKAPEAIRKTIAALDGLLTVYNSIPGDLIEAGAMGLVGKLLFNNKVGAILAAFSLITSAMDRLTGTKGNFGIEGMIGFGKDLKNLYQYGSLNPPAPKAENADLFSGKASVWPQIDVEAFSGGVFAREINAYQAAMAKVQTASTAAGNAIKTSLTDSAANAAKKLREEAEKINETLGNTIEMQGLDDLDKKLLEIQIKYDNLARNPLVDRELLNKSRRGEEDEAVADWIQKDIQDQVKAAKDYQKQMEAMNASVKKGAEETAAAIKKQYDAETQILRDKLELYKGLEGFEDEYRRVQLDWIERIKNEEIKATGDVLAAEKKAAKDRAAIEYQLFKTKTDYIADGFGQLQSAFSSIASTYEKGSDAAKEWEAAAKAMEIAQKAVAVVQAVAAIATQGLGDPYTAFARIAAMAATMGALLATIGESVGFASGGSGATSAYQFSSTVLGAEEGTGSESLQKSWELLQNTYDMEYEKLTRIYNELKDLNGNITGLVTSIIRTGSVGEIPFEESDPQTFFNAMNEGSQSAINLVKWIPIMGTLLEWTTLGLNKLFEGIFGGGAFAVGKQELVGSLSGILFGKGSVGDLLSGGGIDAKSYQEWTTRTTTDFWRDDSYDYNYREQALAEETRDLINNVFRGMSETLVELSRGLGQDVNAAMNYVFSGAKLNLQGMDAEQISKAVNEFFSAQADAAVSALFGTLLKGYQEVGESLTDTAVRLMVDKEIVLEVLEKTGQSYVAATDRTIAFSESLIKLAGDLETLTDIAATYYDKFYSEEEKHLRLQEQLATVLSSLNMVLPATRSAYRQLVEGLDLTTTTGQEAYVTLLKLASGADAYYAVLEEGAEKVKTAAELMAEAIDTVFADLNSAMDAQISQSRKMASQYRSLSNTYQSITESLTAAQNEINGRGAAGAAGRFDALMAGALTGDTQSMQGLPQAAKELLAESQKSAGSAEEYKRIQGQVLLELEKARIISVAHTNWYDYFATVFDTQTGLLEEIKENLQLPTPDLDLLEKQAGLLTNISKLLEGQTAQIVSGNNLQALILHDQTGKIILANQLTTDQTGQIVLGNNWLTDLSGATKFGIAVAASQAKDAIEATNEGAASTTASVSDLKSASLWMMAQEYFLEQAGQSEAARAAANAIQATAKVSELIAGGVDINSAEKINEYLQEVETALTGNNTWEAIQARKAMAEIRKTTEDGLLTTAEAEATKAALKTLQDVTTFIGVAQYNLAQTGQSEAATQAANAIAATAKVSELIAGGVDINSAEKINEYLQEVETALTGNNTWEAIQARKAMAEIRKTTEDGLLTTAEAETTTKALGQLQDATAVQLMYQYSATKTGLSGVQTALNGQTVEIVNGNVVIKDQNGLIVSSNQLLKDQTGKIIIGNELTDDQTVQVITGNAISDVIKNLQKTNADYSSEMLNALITRESDQNASLAGILRANQTAVSLIRQLVDLTNQSQKEKWAAELAAAQKDLEPLAITAWVAAVKRNEAEAAIETARANESESVKTSAVAESSQAREAYRQYVQTLGAYGQFSNYSERQEDLASGTPFSASGYWTYGAQTANNNALYAAYLNEFNEAYALRNYTAPDSAASVQAAITTAQAASKQAAESLKAFTDAKAAYDLLAARYQNTYGELPAFASGGSFSGGLRIVGEEGPELEMTGPSYIANASKTEALLTHNAELLKEIQALRTELKAALYQTAKNTGRAAQVLDRTLTKWDEQGMPAEATI